MVVQNKSEVGGDEEEIALPNKLTITIVHHCSAGILATL